MFVGDWAIELINAFDGKSDASYSNFLLLINFCDRQILISQMTEVKKVNNARPRLIIQIQDFERKIEEFKQTSFKNGVEVKPLRSAKNKHQLNTFDFPEPKVQVCNTNRKFRKLRKLQEQNVNLMESLQILKVSAVSAIAEKEEQIEKLKVRSRYMQDDDIQIYQVKLQEEKIAREQIQKEREQLYQKLHEQRERFARDLEEREDNLELLQQYIQQIKRELDQYQQMDQAKTKKLKLLQQQNHLLSEQLQLSSISTALKDRTENIMDLDETIKASHPLSVSSSLPNRSFYSYVDSDHLFQSEADKSYMTEKLEEIEKSHKQELLDLRSFYEKRISSIRQVYERQLRLPTEQSQKQILQTRSRRSSRDSRCLEYQRSPSRKKIEGLQLNLNNIYPIEEGIQNQLQTARSNVMNLQHELIMESLSQCPNVEPRFNTNQDNQSQFTTKYFQIPTRFMKKNASSDSLTINNDLQYKLNTKKNLKVEEAKETVIQKNEDQSFAKKSFIFAAGLISGVTLTSLIGYVFTKK